MSKAFSLPSYFAKLGADGIKMVKAMPRITASEWLSIKHPDLTPEEKEDALKICAPDATDARFKKPEKSIDRMFLTAAWLAGASYNQLAKLGGTSRQNMVEKLDRVLPREERNAARLVDPPLSEARLGEMKLAFETMVGENDKVFDGLHPVRVAAILIAVPSETED